MCDETALYREEDHFMITEWDDSRIEVVLRIVTEDEITMEYTDGLIHSVSRKYFASLKPAFRCTLCGPGAFCADGCHNGWMS